MLSFTTSDLLFILQSDQISSQRKTWRWWRSVARATLSISQRVFLEHQRWQNSNTISNILPINVLAHASHFFNFIFLYLQAKRGKTPFRFTIEPAPPVPSPSRHPSRVPLPPPENPKVGLLDATPRSMAGKIFKGALIPQLIEEFGK